MADETQSPDKAQGISDDALDMVQGAGKKSLSASQKDDGETGYSVKPVLVKSFQTGGSTGDDI